MRPISTNETTKNTILIVDDSMMNRALLSDILGDKYDIIEAEDGEQAINILQQRAAEISLVVLDMVMPKVDGFGVLEAMNKHRWIQYIPVVAISAETSPDFIERSYNMGVTDFINRPFDALIVIRRVDNTVKLYAKQRQLMNMVANEILEKERNGNLMVTILSHIVEFRNGESGMHVINIGKITEILLAEIAKHTTQYHLSYADRDLIVKASALHDIGKISIDEHILNKPGRLTDEEFEHIKTHTVIGHQMLADVPFQDEPLIKTSREIARWHHERYDGRGYPDGLVGDDIPISAQVVALADVYDALTSERVYKPPFDHKKAVDMILNGECGTFNPLLLECLVDAQDTIQQELNKPGEVFDSYEELQLITPAIQNTETLDVTEYVLGQLENERQKNHFSAEVSRDLQFDYNIAFDTLTIPVWAAKRYDVPTAISNPAKKDKVIEVVGEQTIQKLHDAIRATTPNDPLIRLDFTMNDNDEKLDCMIIAKSLWVFEEEPSLIGYVGKILHRDDRTDWLETPFELSNGRGSTYIHDVTSDNNTPEEKSE